MNGHSRGSSNSSSKVVRNHLAAAAWQHPSVCRARRWLPVLSISLLLAYAAFLLLTRPAWTGAPADSSSVGLRMRLFRPSYCSALTASWPTHNSTSSAAAATTSTPPAVAEAVVHAFMSVHAAAEQSLELAGAIWKSKGRAGAEAGQPSSKQQEARGGLEVATAVAHLNLSAVLAGVGEYPAGSSSGRGIVLVGGGPKYTPPAFGCVVFIRRSGCQLPVEVFAPPHEAIPPAVAAELAALGNVTVRSLGDALPLDAHDNMQQQRFLAKQLALLVSSFQEVLFLDSDNLPLQDPTFLFEDPLYRQHGLLMWPDFWRSEVKPGAWEALGVSPDLRPAGSHESGQVLIDKTRAWRPLLLAIYLNMRGDVFHPLLSDNGQGDKETLPIAWLALGLGQYGLVPHGVMALGYINDRGNHDGRAMLQRSPDGIPLFLHNHWHKMDVPRDDLSWQLPPPLGSARRSWDVLTGQVEVLPPSLNVSKFEGKLNSYEVLNAVAGCDVEVEVLQLRRYLRCQPAWVECCLA